MEIQSHQWGREQIEQELAFRCWLRGLRSRSRTLFDAQQTQTPLATAHATPSLYSAALGMPSRYVAVAKARN